MTYEKTLLQLAQKHKLTHVENILISAQELEKDQNIDIAILGQFKAGKSSLINSLLDRDILPVGVVPVTSVITRIFFQNQEFAKITFLDNTTKTVEFSDLPQYITENQNPNNQKNVAFADISIKQMQKYYPLRFIDTPGLGSIFQNNSQTTTDWISKSTVAIIVISAERPLAEQDQKLLDLIKQYSYDIACIITKADLFNQQQLSEIKTFISQGLEKLTGRQNIPVFLYSTVKNTENYKQIIYNKLFKPLIDKAPSEVANIYKYKILRAAYLALNYFNIAYQASIKNLQQQQELKDKILDQKTNSNYLFRQVQVLASDIKSQTRKNLEKILLPYRDQIINKLTQDFIHDFPNWKGNLYKISRQYEHWLKQKLSEAIKQTIEKENHKISDILQQAANQLNFFANTFKENINRNLVNVLGIELKSQPWKVKFTPISSPDISVYRAFDTNIDLLWFLFPMFLFKNFFRKSFLRQIPLEVEKNLYRTVSILTGLINKEIDNLSQKIINYILEYIETIENALSAQKSKSSELLQNIQTLTQIVNQLENPNSN